MPRLKQQQNGAQNINTSLEQEMEKARKEREQKEMQRKQEEEEEEKRKKEEEEAQQQELDNAGREKDRICKWAKSSRSLLHCAWQRQKQKLTAEQVDKNFPQLILTSS